MSLNLRNWGKMSNLLNLFAAFIFYDFEKKTCLTAYNVGYTVCVLNILQGKRDRENKTRKIISSWK